MVCNLVDLDGFVEREILERFDHENLNTLPEFDRRRCRQPKTCAPPSTIFCSAASPTGSSGKGTNRRDHDEFVRVRGRERESGNCRNCSERGPLDAISVRQGSDAKLRKGTIDTMNPAAEPADSDQRQLRRSCARNDCSDRRRPGPRRSGSHARSSAPILGIPHQGL